MKNRFPQSYIYPTMHTYLLGTFRTSSSLVESPLARYLTTYDNALIREKRRIVYEVITHIPPA